MKPWRFILEEISAAVAPGAHAEVASTLQAFETLAPGLRARLVMPR